MLEFIILMVILDLLMKWQVGEEVEVEPSEVEYKGDRTKFYVMNNTAEWDFESLDDAMEFRELRLSGWKGNAIDFYRYKEEE